MDALALCAKAALAVMLIVAGGAKLADRAGFAAVVRLFVPMRALAPAYNHIATAIALAEVILGCASLSFPAVKWINLLVLIAGCAFIIVSVTGLVRHRGRSCSCFGPLSQRKFDVQSVLRSIAIAAFAAVAMIGVSASSVRLGVTTQALLLIAAAMLLTVSYVAAKVLAGISEVQPRVGAR
jgi:hypothetical protein